MTVKLATRTGLVDCLSLFMTTLFLFSVILSTTTLLWKFHLIKPLLKHLKTPKNTIKLLQNGTSAKQKEEKPILLHAKRSTPYDISSLAKQSQR
ncbi:hypothetical protein BDZ45DRAFT_49660 [Acephala macrosclerotiorum]|nr:hypothetical protein BDZ45DRAFT_49660 [Acephala macrosclerotiorum]